MPINRSEFEKGNPDIGPDELLTYFKENKNEAFNKAELMKLVFKRVLSTEENKEFDEELDGLVFFEWIEQKTINGIVYYAHKQ